MLGIINPESRLHRSRSDSCPGTPATARSPFLSPRSAESSHARHSSLPGALSLAEAYNVIAADVSCVCLVYFFTNHIDIFFLFSVTRCSPPSTCYRQRNEQLVTHSLWILSLTFNLSMYMHACVIPFYTRSSLSAGILFIHFQLYTTLDQSAHITGMVDILDIKWTLKLVRCRTHSRAYWWWIDDQMLSSLGVHWRSPTEGQA